jgi:hypothetical protein
MVLVSIRIHDVDRLVATLKPVLDEGKQNSILLIVAVEKRTDMTRFAEFGAGKGNGCGDLLHRAFLPDESLVKQVTTRPSQRDDSSGQSSALASISRKSTSSAGNPAHDSENRIDNPKHLVLRRELLPINAPLLEDAPCASRASIIL